MDSWVYYVSIFVDLVILIVALVAITFFRRLYMMVEEVTARLIQIREMMEKQASPRSKRDAHPR